VHRGTLTDLDSLRSGADASDGVIHTAFLHDFSDYEGAGQTDRRAIEALAGSDRPLVVTSGTGGIAPGRLATEEDASTPGMPRVSEDAALSFVGRGVRVSVVRLPPSVHSDADRHGFVRRLIAIAREQGVSAYPGDGSNRWAAVHQLDAAHLFALALEGASEGARLHAVGDEGVPVRDIAEVIGRHLNLPVTTVPSEEVERHFGWLGAFFSMDIPASSALTQKLLDWQPVHAALIPDLEAGHHFID